MMPEGYSINISAYLRENSGMGSMSANSTIELGKLNFEEVAEVLVKLQRWCEQIEKELKNNK